MDAKNSNKESGAAQQLTYEQLKAYAAQTTEQAKQIFRENQMLKKALYDQRLREVEIALKCLDHADKFSTAFIDSVVQRIEQIMSPQREDTEKEEKEEEK